MLDKRACLAYLLGAYLSDGTLYWNCREPHPKWEIKDESFADCISIALSTLGSSHTFECNSSGYFVVYERAGGKLGEWLNDVAPDKDCLPQIPRELVRPLVAGLMDGDGSISRHKYERAGGWWYQLYYCGSKGFVLKFKDLLGTLGVKQGKLHCREGDAIHSLLWRWSINLESFLKAGFTFAMPRKQERLALWCDQVTRSSKSCEYPKKTAIARWWMSEVFPRDWASPIPTGSYTFGDA